MIIYSNIVSKNINLSAQSKSISSVSTPYHRQCLISPTIILKSRLCIPSLRLSPLANDIETRKNQSHAIEEYFDFEQMSNCAAENFVSGKNFFVPLINQHQTVSKCLTIITALLALRKVGFLGT